VLDVNTNQKNPIIGERAFGDDPKSASAMSCAWMGGLRDGGWMGEGRPKGGHALAILPGLTHYNLGISPLFTAVTLSFLDQQEG